jgi:uncharacterized membrane protein
MSFSYAGLAVGTLFFAASLTPSLLPRHFVVQGVLSGLALAVGYGVGVLSVWLWTYLEIGQPSELTQLVAKRITTAVVAIAAAWFLWRATIWQNSIRQLMDMEPVESAYPLRVALIAALTGLVLVLACRGLIQCGRFVHRHVARFVPRRVSYVLSTVVVVAGLVFVVNGVFARLALDAADSIFERMDRIIDEGVGPPTDARASGSAESLIAWNTIGRYGKAFIVDGPTEQQIADFLGKHAMRPLRVYVGLESKETVQERAKLALKELIRAGGFSRSVLVVATPTGTGWLDPGGVDTVEYMHGGDTAIVSMQYSYLPSWMTILIDPARSQDSAAALFDAVYDHWKTLPTDKRPKLYVFGLSLGALGSAASADLLTIFEDPIHGGVWSGPPFPSTPWSRATAKRNPDSPMWLPRFRDGSILRFTGQNNSLNDWGKRWGPMRFVYIQHASDPMTFFSPESLYHEPGWLVGARGPDVSPYLRWYPIVTFLQTGFDLPMATSVPTGFGHNYAPASYIDAWEAVTAPKDWTEGHTQRLKQRFKTQ